MFFTAAWEDPARSQNIALRFWCLVFFPKPSITSLERLRWCCMSTCMVSWCLGEAKSAILHLFWHRSHHQGPYRGALWPPPLAHSPSGSAFTLLPAPTTRPPPTHPIILTSFAHRAQPNLSPGLRKNILMGFEGLLGLTWHDFSRLYSSYVDKRKQCP